MGSFLDRSGQFTYVSAYSIFRQLHSAFRAACLPCGKSALWVVYLGTVEAKASGCYGMLRCILRPDIGA